MAPNDSEKTDAEALEDGLRLVVNFLAAALLTGPRNEYLVELQAKYVECMNVVKAQQHVLEMQQNEMQTMQTRLAEVAARLEAVLARGATLDDDEMAMSSPVTPVDPYETPKASKGKRSPRASSGT